MTLLPTSRSWVIKTFSSWSQSKTSWPHLVQSSASWGRPAQISFNAL